MKILREILKNFFLCVTHLNERKNILNLLEAQKLIYKKYNINNTTLKLLLVTIILIFVYHSYKLYIHYSQHKYISYVNLFHILVLVPLLLY